MWLLLSKFFSSSFFQTPEDWNGELNIQLTDKYEFTEDMKQKNDEREWCYSEPY